MKVEELQAGDWVQLNFGGEYPEEIRLVTPKDLSNICFLHCAKGIEITKDILKKNGFTEKSEKCYSRRTPQDTYIEYDFENKYLTIEGKRANYGGLVITLNQLQRALNASFVDLEINL